MYQGYITCGESDPFSVPPEMSTEIINNPRAYAYARWASLPWVIPCDECDGVEIIASQGRGYLSPILDPAPWFDANNPDSWDFLGVLGMEIAGASDSTRQASVSMSLTGIGVIGRTYQAPRELTIRAIVIARNDCGLEFGMTWLRHACTDTMNPCGGDPVTFFDCCPCICQDEDPSEPCWPDIYFELEFFPLCDADCEDETDPACFGDWPATYAGLNDGTGADPTLFPTWAVNYGQLILGPPDAACWPTTYIGLVEGPECTVIGPPSGLRWWPVTYQELIDGPPPPFDEDWCDWPDNYFELATGPPPYACCVDACLGPYMRQFHNARITKGPVILQRPSMTCGAMLEVEFTIVAADPEPHAMPFGPSGGLLGADTDTLIDDEAPLSVLDPFAAVS